MSAGNRKHPYRMHNQYQDNLRRRQERNHHVAMLLLMVLLLVTGIVIGATNC